MIAPDRDGAWAITRLRQRHDRRGPVCGSHCRDKGGIAGLSPLAPTKPTSSSSHRSEGGMRRFGLWRSEGVEGITSRVEKRRRTSRGRHPTLPRVAAMRRALLIIAVLVVAASCGGQDTATLPQYVPDIAGVVTARDATGSSWAPTPAHGGREARSS